MPLFQVSSRTAQPSLPEKKRSLRLLRLRQRWIAIQLRLIVGGLTITALVILLSRIGLNYLFFFLLPVIVTIIIVSISNALSRRAKSNMLLTIVLALIYFSAVAGWELLTHPPSTSEIIVVGTTLALAVLFEPGRNWIQTLLEQRFHLGEDQAVKAIEAFTSTLREEIDMDKVRDGLLAVAQQTMQPQSVSVWVRKAAQPEASRPEQQASPIESLFEASPSEIAVADDDPFIPYALAHPDAVEVGRLQLDSPVLRILKKNQVEIGLPFVSQGELIGLLTLGPLADGQKYTRVDRRLLNTLAAQVAPALRVAQLVQEQQIQVRQRERIEQELRTAQEIQHTFLPKEVPALLGWQLIPYYQSAREVGGDFYDFLPFADGRLGIVIGDVTDKGVPAALVMMPGTCYEEYESTLTPGERLLFYSDGLEEAHNARHEMFGFPRLKTLLEEHSDGASLIAILLDELKRFTGEGWEQEDDVTLVTLQRTLEHHKG